MENAWQDLHKTFNFADIISQIYQEIVKLRKFKVSRFTFQILIRSIIISQHNQLDAGRLNSGRGHWQDWRKGLEGLSGRAVRLPPSSARKFAQPSAAWPRGVRSSRRQLARQRAWRAGVKRKAIAILTADAICETKCEKTCGDSRTSMIDSPQKSRDKHGDSFQKIPCYADEAVALSPALSRTRWHCGKENTSRRKWLGRRKYMNRRNENKQKKIESAVALWLPAWVSSTHTFAGVLHAVWKDYG